MYGVKSNFHSGTSLSFWNTGWCCSVLGSATSRVERFQRPATSERTPWLVEDADAAVAAPRRTAMVEGMGVITSSLQYTESCEEHEEHEHEEAEPRRFFHEHCGLSL